MKIMLCSSRYHTVGAETGNADLLKTGFTSWADLITVQYSATDNGPLSNNKFPFQVVIVEVNHI